MNKKSFSQQQVLTLVQAIRRGIEKAKHHVNYDARVHKVINAEINAVIPGCTCYFRRGVSLGTIGVWHGSLCDYDQRFYACWNNNWAAAGSGSSHWSEPILEELKRCDPSDTMEREQQERAILPDFIALNNRAAKLMQDLEQVRTEAQITIRGLPIPNSATVRASSVHWDRPSGNLVAMFPELFPSS